MKKYYEEEAWHSNSEEKSEEEYDEEYDKNGKCNTNYEDEEVYILYSDTDHYKV